MPDIQTFAALRFNPVKTQIEDVVAPPYDVITRAERAALCARSPFNIVRVELPEGKGEQEKYDEAATLVRAWIAEGVLWRDAQPGFYVYDQEFTNAAGARVTRHGFFAACRLEEFSRGMILPHERTLSGPKEDRLKLLRATEINTSPIFALYLDPEQRVRRMLEHGAAAPDADFVDGAGVRHVLRRAAGGRVMDDVREAMLERRAYIADGHHRYETALKYRDELRARHPEASPDAPWNFVLMYFAAMEGEGMEIQATHRLLHGLPKCTPAVLDAKLAPLFDVVHYAMFADGLAALHGEARDAMLMAFPGGACMLVHLRPTVDRAAALGPDVPDVLRDLSVTILHRLILRDQLGITEEAQLRKEHLDYVHTVDDVRVALASGAAQCAVLLNAAALHQLRASAEAGVPMPQKSTYFYPKLLTGLVLRDVSLSSAS